MRKLDDIIPPSRRKETEQPAIDMLPQEPGGSRPSREPLKLRPRPPRFPYGTLVGIFVVIFLSIAALFYFSSAEVQVTPNTVTTAVQNSFTADKSTGTLPFEILSAQKIASQSVQGSGTKTVNTKASGKLTIYNTQAKSQRLVASTRFASPAGLIYRISGAVTVPAGTATKPGSVSATVTADQTGATYNIGPTSFTVPGLAGTAIADKVYARSTDAMTGGASGTIPVVDSATEATAVAALKTALGPDLASGIKNQIPSGYVLLPGASQTTYTELTPAPSSTTGQVDVKEEGTITAVIFPSAALASSIANSVTGLGYQGEPLALSSTDGLTLTPISGFPDPSASQFAFTLAGTANLTYTVEESRIAAAVAGKSRSAAEVALTNYPEVKRAVLVLRPFWRSSFPEDPTSIKVVVENATQ